jgi:hypothetical protein
MKYKQQDSRVCMYYIADKLNRILSEPKKEMEKALKEFHEEMIYNLGINSMHNHFGEEND